MASTLAYCMSLVLSTTVSRKDPATGANLRPVAHLEQIRQDWWFWWSSEMRALLEQDGK